MTDMLPWTLTSRLAAMNLDPVLSTSDVVANIYRTRELYLPVIKRLRLEN